MAMPEPFGFSDIRYLPEEVNVWMYAMIAIGAAFLIFVGVTVYLMWRTMNNRRNDVEREALCEGEQKPPRSSLTSLPSDTISCAYP